MREQSKKIIDDLIRTQIAKRGAGNATAIVCAPASDPAVFEDDKFDVCGECGIKVRYRPYMPDLPKLCLPCWSEMTGPTP